LSSTIIELGNWVDFGLFGARLTQLNSMFIRQ